MTTTRSLLNQRRHTPQKNLEHLESEREKEKEKERERERGRERRKKEWRVGKGL
jgi:hypothetical protein